MTVPDRFDSMLKQKPLSREEEVELGKLVELGDKKAADKLVTANLRFVMRMAHQYKGYGSFEDLVQEGCLGLIEAVKKWDWRRDIKLISYASWWIRAYIFRFLMNNHSLVKALTTTSSRQLFFHLKRKVGELENQGVGLSDAINSVAKNAGMSEETAAAFYSFMVEKPVSMDEELESGGTFSNFMPSQMPSPEELLLEKELVGLVRMLFNKVTRNERDAVFVDERVLAEVPKTLLQMGEMYGISRERARQIEAVIFKRLHQLLTISGNKLLLVE